MSDTRLPLRDPNGLRCRCGGMPEKRDVTALLFDGHYGPKLEQAETRVYTNELDALEALIAEGLPPDEMQAAAWVLVQRVRGLQDDLRRVERARASWQREAQRG